MFNWVYIASTPLTPSTTPLLPRPSFPTISSSKGFSPRARRRLMNVKWQNFYEYVQAWQHYHTALNADMLVGHHYLAADLELARLLQHDRGNLHDKVDHPCKVVDGYAHYTFGVGTSDISRVNVCVGSRRDCADMSSNRTSDRCVAVINCSVNGCRLSYDDKPSAKFSWGDMPEPQCVIQSDTGRLGGSKRGHQEHALANGKVRRTEGGRDISGASLLGSSPRSAHNTVGGQALADKGKKRKTFICDSHSHLCDHPCGDSGGLRNDISLGNPENSGGDQRAVGVIADR